jgi:L-aspartate oxidase
LSSSSLEIPRHLDVLVVGAGAAGLYGVLCLPQHYQVGLITKDNLKIGASDWAQGGIAAAINPDDSPQLHYEDTLKAGAGLCEDSAVKFLVDNAGKAIDSLVDLGVGFDRHQGKLSMTLEAAHSRPRVLHAADTTGKAIVATLTEKVLERPNIRVFEQALALQLWIDPHQGHCRGLSLFYQGKIHWISASAVILATGGGGQVFAQTTNPTVSTGDGVAIAWRGGALLRDLEFFQFHPTALNLPNAPHFLISEAVRGEGAHLIDEKGDRFAFDYHPAGELAPRDVVSRAIFSHLHKINDDPSTAKVYLDLQPIPKEKIAYRFPNIIQVCQKYGVDIFSQPIPVSPAAHYWMGGIVTDTATRTSIQGLYAIGETASTGVHGANRLASNSLLECLVYADQLSNLQIDCELNHEEYNNSEKITLNITEDIALIKEIRQELPILMWNNAGICREEKGLGKAIAQVENWRSAINQLEFTPYLKHFSPLAGIEINLENVAIEDLKLYTETLNLLDIGLLILKSADFRQESRGGHYRLDYPQSNPSWECHTLVLGDRIYSQS